MSTTPGVIPKILHYCFGFSEDFGGKPFSLSHWACIKSAIDRIKPERAFLYYEYEPSGPWWDKVTALVEPVRIEAPRQIFGKPLAHPAHRSDITRLEKLIEMGGIYLDTDVFVHKSFDPLLGYSSVLGREDSLSQQKLCNAVMLAEPNAPFLTKWYESYQDFRGNGRGKFWNEHSVIRPGQLASLYPADIHIVSEKAFFWPLFFPKDLHLIFRSNEPIVGPDTFATHLWENKAWRKYLDLLTPGTIRRGSSNFDRWVAPMLEGIPDDFGAPGLARRVNNVKGRCEDVYVDLNVRVSNRLGRLSRAS